MASARKVKANRANAQASTGPKTAQGKARTAHNARRHGLSLSILADPVLSTEAESLARKIAGQGATREILGLARRVAEAQIDVMRVRQARLDLLSRNLNDLDYRPDKYFRSAHATIKIIARHMRKFGPETPLPPEVTQLDDFDLHRKPEGAEKFAYILFDLAREFGAMDRYERRALSRRKFAIRAFDAARKQIGIYSLGNIILAKRSQISKAFQRPAFRRAGWSLQDHGGPAR